MKTKKDWENEISKLLSGKVAAAIKQYQENRNMALDELTTLGGQLDALEGKTKDLHKEKSGLNLLINAELARSNEIDRSFPRLAKQTKGAQARINELVTRLTEVPDTGIAWLNFLTQLKKEKL